jgi:DNA invertase Pin-like site-specific DNA recombinase
MIIGYLRVSTGGQTVDSQRLAIYEAGYKPDHWYEINGSSTLPLQRRRVDELLEQLQTGDTLVVTELSRLGRSIGQIVTLVDALLHKKVRLHCLKEGIKLDGSGQMDMQTEVMCSLFGLFSSIERRLISERTKEGIARARQAGAKIGRPKGVGKSKLDEHKQDLKKWLELGLNPTAISKLLQVSRTAVTHYIKTRNIL